MEDQVTDVEVPVVPTAEEAGTTAEVTELPVDGQEENLDKEAPAEKQFTQAELEAEIGKRLARQERKLKRELTASSPEPLKIKSNLDPTEFSTTDAYLDALAEEKAEALISHREAVAKASAVDGGYREREELAIDKYPDFEFVAYNPEIRITTEMAEVIKASEQGPELAYYLGGNPKEAERISGLSALAQARELGRLEARLEAEPADAGKKPAISKAPAPITPVRGGVKAPSYETTDPRSTSTMTASEWIAADRARRAKALAAKSFK